MLTLGARHAERRTPGRGVALPSESASGLFGEYISSQIVQSKCINCHVGGGVQVPAGSADFANMERFVRLLEGGSSTADPSPETLFDGVTMAEPEKTLRRAALISAGRLPTRAEIGAVTDGRASSLRRAIRNLMKGPRFQAFLIRDRKIALPQEFCKRLI